jgi:RecA-family ATPase
VSDPYAGTFDEAYGETEEERRAREAKQPTALPYVDLTLGLVPRPWLIADRIPRRNVTLLSGEGGIGKSVLLMQLLGATALGGCWLGTFPGQGSAIYLSAEEEENEIRHRMEDVARSLGSSRRRMEENGLHVLSFAGRDSVLGQPDRHGFIRPTPLFERIREDALRTKPKLIAFDAAADVFAGDEVNRSQTRQFVTLLRGLAMDTDSTVILVAHPSLTGITSGSGLSGSTAWHNSVRARLYLKQASKDDNSLRALEVKKNNYGPVNETILLRWENGVYVAEGIGTSEEQAERVLERLAEEDKSDALFLTLLRRFTKQGRNVSDKAGPTYAPTEFAKDPEAKKAKVNSKALAEAMARLFAAEKITVINEGPPSRRRSRIVETERKPTFSSTPSNDPSNPPSNDLPTPSNGGAHTHPPYPPSPLERDKGGVGSPAPSNGGQGGQETNAAAGASAPFMITRAMKAALRARGLTDDEITELTPAEAHAILDGKQAADEPLMSWEADDLRRRGFCSDELFTMAPHYAREILADPKRNKLSERYGLGGDAPADTLCCVCKKPGARLFGEPLAAGEREDRFPGTTPLHLECCPKWFEGGLAMEYGRLSDPASG